MAAPIYAESALFWGGLEVAVGVKTCMTVVCLSIYRYVEILNYWISEIYVGPVQGYLGFTEGSLGSR